MGSSTDDNWEREGWNASPAEKGIGESGVRLSEVIVTGRQKMESSEANVAKAWCSSCETVVWLAMCNGLNAGGGVVGLSVYIAGGGVGT